MLSALSVVTRWLCCRSAATTWATTSSTGSKWARSSATRLRRSSTSTGSVLDDEGHFIWPGFGDNLRVLEWILKRCDNEVDAVETAIGYVPKPEDINLEGLKDFDEEKLASILKVDNAKWAKEAAGVEEFYKKFGDKLPQELRDELNGLEERTKA